MGKCDKISLATNQFRQQSIDIIFQIYKKVFPGISSKKVTTNSIQSGSPECAD